MVQKKILQLAAFPQGCLYFPSPLVGMSGLSFQSAQSSDLTYWEIGQDCLRKGEGKLVPSASDVRAGRRLMGKIKRTSHRLW